MINKINKYSGVTGVVYLDEKPKKFAVTQTRRGTSIPGGGIDENDKSTTDAIYREIEEELGLAATAIELHETELIESFQYDADKEGRKNEKVDRQIFFFFFLSDKLNPNDEEILSAKWCTYDEAMDALSWDNSKDTLKRANFLLEQL
mgnify:CR=1 FL=1